MLEILKDPEFWSTGIITSMLVITSIILGFIIGYCTTIKIIKIKKKK